jgi:ABC-type nitrate/sulfonate/bicarbonate transport system permease component
MVMGGQGLGARMIINARNADSPAVFAGIIEIAVVGNVLIGAMQTLRHRILYWID